MNTDEILTRGVANVLPDKKQLAGLMKKRKITLYQGFDPTAPSLHIGHFIGIRKLAQFQKLGHKVIFLIGDFTGIIGDPTDKTAARKKQTREEVLENLKDYKKQVEKVIKFDGKNPAEVKFNSTWLSKLNFEDVVEIASHFTVSQMIERDMFQERIKTDKPIYLHEFFYPLMQGYDSVAMEVDLEIGGNDQLFNMLSGRNLLKEIKNKEKYVLSMKLLTDETGRKMGKTEGNAVFLNQSAPDIFRTITNWPDSFIPNATELLTDLPLDLFKNKDAISAKKSIAYEIIKQIKGEIEADEALSSFESYEKSGFPGKPTHEFKHAKGLTIRMVIEKASGASGSQVKQLISSGAIKVNGNKISGADFIVSKGDEIRIGKNQFVKVI